MKKILCSLAAILAGLAMYSQTPVPPGNISGTWTEAGSPYLVQGETTIPNGQTLTIEPGVTVEWQGSYKMLVEGRILAQGTETDSITFTAADTATGWKSIRFQYTLAANDTSRFGYCVFRHGKAHGAWPDNCGGAIGMIGFSELVIDHCLFDRNEALDTTINPGPTNPNAGGGAIALRYASPVVKNSRFTNNIAVSSGAISCMECDVTILNNEFFNNSVISYASGWGEGYGGALGIYLEADPEVSGNIFRNNHSESGGGALCIVDKCNPALDHNLIDHNTASWGGGIEIQDSCSPVLINNTIADNQAQSGGGIDVWNSCEPVFRNTIIWNNIATGAGNQVNINDPTDVPDFYYCDIMGGQAAFGGYPPTGAYMNCIDLDPVFIAPENHCYYLWNVFSPCIDAGDPDPVYNDPDGSRNDMGAQWPPRWPDGIPGEGISGKAGIAVYPNPARDEVTIRWINQACFPLLAFSSFSVIRISDIHGKEVMKIPTVQMVPGEYSVRVNLTGIPMGMYFVTLKAGDRQVMEKLVIK